MHASEFQRNAGFVRRLARRLAVDEASAEDLAQETWLAAVQRLPEDRGHLRSWLGRVLRNKAAQELRSSARRAVRERDAARSEAVVETSEIAARMELHRRVIEAVLTFPEPYRVVLLRRFGEDETAAEIAHHLHLPERTVRTRLQRGLVKLRARLRGEVGGSSALVLSLTKLAGPTGTPTGAPASSPVSAVPQIATLKIALTLLVMKKAIAFTLIAVASLVAVWSFVSRPSPKPGRVPSKEVVAQEPAPIEPAQVPATWLTATPDERVALAVETEEEPAPGLTEPSEKTRPAKGSEGTIGFRIEDEFGNPIAHARLEATVIRSRQEPGSSMSWLGDGFMGESNADGIVDLTYPYWRSSLTKGDEQTGFIGFRVTHPEYITHEEWQLDVEAEEGIVVLRRGSFLIVSGWIESPDEEIVDVSPHLTDEVKSAAADWIPLRDGRPSCSRVPPGTHALYLSHETEAGERFYSEVTPFELAEGEEKALHLELLPPRRMLGELDAEVLRPVQDGEVELNLYVGARGDDAVMLRTYRAAVAPDGSFAFEDLPPGTGELIGMCDGWVSARERLAESNWYTDEEGEERWREKWAHYQLDPVAHLEEPYVLPMEPTGSVELTVLDPGGTPVEGARVLFWPNVHWTIGYSSIFLDRTWEATTNVDGVALVENVPGGDGEHFAVYAREGYMMPLRTDRFGRESRNAWVDVPVGERVQYTIELAPPEAGD